MATIAEMLIGSALESSQKVPDTAGNLRQGAELGLQIEKTRMLREQHEQQKAQVREQKMENMTADILKARTLGGKALSGYRQFLKNKAQVLKLDDIYTSEAIDLVTSVPENIDRFDVIVNQVTSGEMTYEQGANILKDEGLFYEIDPVERQRLAAAAKTATLEANKATRAETAALGMAARAEAERDAAGRVEFNKQTAKAARDYKDQIANIQFNFKKLKETYAALNNKDAEPGKGLLRFVGGYDSVVDIADKDVAAARDSVRSAIIGTLRPILGGQFAEKEGERIMSLAFNAKFTAEENAKRVRDEIDRAIVSAKRKEDEYVRQGYMTDSERADLSFSPKKQKVPSGKIPQDKKDGYKTLSGDEKKKAISIAAKKYGISEKEAKEQLEAK